MDDRTCQACGRWRLVVFAFVRDDGQVFYADSRAGAQKLFDEAQQRSNVDRSCGRVVRLVESA